MSGALINDYSQTDSDILAVQLTLDSTRIGMHQVSLTNYDSTSESQIAAGSIIEVGGALYKFTSNESITGSPSDGTVYIMIVPGTTTCTAQYTNTAPTWSNSKQGFYGTGGSANYRYLEYVLYLHSSAWTGKFNFNRINGKIRYSAIVNIGTWNMDTTASADIILTDNGINFYHVKSINVQILSDTGYSLFPLWADGGGCYYQCYITSDFIRLTRATGGAWFDSSAFSGSGNRGYITFTCEI